MTEITAPNKRNTAVLVDDRAVSGLISFDIAEKLELHHLRELLSGEISAPTVVGKEYRITLKTAFDDIGIESGETVEIKVVTPECARTYFDCRVVSSEDEINEKGEYAMKYIFRSYRMTKDNARGEA